ncbi:MAG TPA: methionine--tRNA ligase [Polyangiaceae bacterium]|nr:methionine--tRNA ligase [Polyangiaceae bacterium]
MSNPRRILVTSALPYANGHIHIGHLVEYIQTDIWVRFQRLIGSDVHYMCADDTHGTAIMLRARQEGITEVELIDAMNRAHQADFAAFNIRFDHYGSTNSEQNRTFCHEIWRALRDRGLVVERQVSQLYDPKEGLFLADRLVKGSCPRCGTAEQYGDSCESCGATYRASDLGNPRSAISGATPETRLSTHLFVTIESLHGFLEGWTQAPGHLQASVANYLRGHFLSAPLEDWDVSRPAPYFGFEIPDAPGNYWYVWFDAPIGYLAATHEWCAKAGRRFDEFWREPGAERVHFIGKDITYFHALFWPAMLQASGLMLPDRIQVHGFLTVNGEKMSKSKGTFIRAASYAEHLDPSYLRYYYASRLTSKVDDLDLDLEDFVARVNSDLVGKVVNLASRTARLILEQGLSPAYPDDAGLFAEGSAAAEEIAGAYESCDYSRAMRAVMKLADRANEYVDRMQPWKLAKDASQSKQLQDVCTVALNLYRQIVLYMAPVLPQLAEQSAELFGSTFDRWEVASRPLVGQKLAPFKHLMTRVDPKRVQAMVEASVEAAPAGDAKGSTSAAASPGAASPGAPSPSGKGGKGGKPAAPAPKTSGSPAAFEAFAPIVSFEDFSKVDLRVARVLSAKTVDGSKKLLELRVDLAAEQRTIFAGIRGAYEPAALEGRLIVVVANLAPRQMKVGTSEGMALAAGDETSVFLLSPDSGAQPGQRVH